MFSRHARVMPAHRHNAAIEKTHDSHTASRPIIAGLLSPQDM
jgi:hypothetical protein